MTLRVESPPPIAAAAAQPESNWTVALKLISRIALHILIPLAAAYFSYLLLPASALALGVPLITICTAFIIAFLPVGEGIFPFGRASPLPAAAPRGIANGAMNCWINSLAQTMRGDEGQKSWFLNFPDEHWERIQGLPLLAPQVMSARALFHHEAPLENYLGQIHPRLQACIEAPNPDIANGRSYYRTYCGDFQGTDQEFVEHIRAPQFALNLYAEDRQKVQNYLRLVEEAPEAARYFQFFAEIAVNERPLRREALVAFQQFLRAYDAAQIANLSRIEFRSQRLREVLSNLNPLIDARAGVQLDPMEALTAIGDFLLPRDLKVAVETRRVYERGANPAMEGGELVRKREESQLGYIQLSIQGDRPNIQEMVVRAQDARNENPELLIRNRAVDGVVYDYRLEREEKQFIQAPPSLWLHLKRMANVQHSGWECLQRLISYWFPRIAGGLQKLDTPITAQPEITLQPAEGEEARYRLGGFIVHRGGSLHSGHYVSYQRVEIEPGNWAWFEMNDSSVRQLSDEEAAECATQGYAFHYSKIV